MTVWLLVVVALVSGSPQGVTRGFSTEAGCKSMIKPLTNKLIESGIQDASVSCVEVKIGTLT